MNVRFALAIAAAIASLGVAPAQAQTAMPNPTAAQVTSAQNAHFCSDPWITLAIWFTTGGTRNPSGVGTLGECNAQLYNGGTWTSYAQLVQAVTATQQALRTAGASISLSDNHNGTSTISVAAAGITSTTTVAVSLVTASGGNIVAQGGGNIVAQGGGNIVAQGGGNFGVLSTGQKSVNLPNNRVLIITGAAPPPAAAPAPAANGACHDPWITQAVGLVAGRAPSGSGVTGECAPANYTGSWSSYADLVIKVGNHLNWPHGKCNDAWIEQSYVDAKGVLPSGTGVQGQCASALYNHGTWKTYPELLGYVKTYLGVR
jgi:hypothetical protein